MKNINELTEDCLIWLFGQFSLQELIELRKVCQLWTVIIEQICQRKKSLKLFRTLKQVAKYCGNLVDYGLHLDKKFLLKSIGKDDELIGYRWTEVSHLFTNVEHLVYYDYSNWRGLEEVLKSMPNIESLFLVGDYSLYDEQRCEDFTKFLQCLNQLASLKHLHFGGVFSERNYEFPEIEIFSKLESLYLTCLYQSDSLKILNQVGASLRKLSFHSSIDFEKFEELFKAKPEVFTKLADLSIRSNYDINENKKLFHFICENFNKLETFKFGSISSFKQDEAIFSLAKLINLTNLSVGGIWDVENSLLTGKIGQIKNLQLKFDNYREIFPQLAVKSIFPNLESITVLANEDELYPKDFLKSAKNYIVDEQKLTCKVQCKLVNTDRLIYMGRHREQLEIEEEERRIQEEQNARQELADKYGDDDYDPYDRYEQQTSSEESYIDPYRYDNNDYDYDYDYDTD